MSAIPPTADIEQPLWHICLMLIGHDDALELKVTASATMHAPRVLFGRHSRGQHPPSLCLDDNAVGSVTTISACAGAQGSNALLKRICASSINSPQDCFSNIDDPRVFV